MIEVKHNLVETLLDQAIAIAKTRNEGQLVSITNKIDDIDPVVFFENGKRIDKDRIFWSSTAEDFYIVAVGNVVEILADKDRFEETEFILSRMLHKAIIHNPYEVAGTGVVALGGLAFDPQKERTRLWSNFQASQFTIPEFILTKKNDQYYFTMIKMVRNDDKASKLLEEWSMIENELLADSTIASTPTRVIDKEEIMPEQWMESVRLAKEKIIDGQAKKIVLAREMRLKLDRSIETETVIQKLLKTQANSYVFAFEKGEDCFVGATPERLVKLNNKRLLSTCLAGTAPRGETEKEDLQIAEQLFHDEKNREEHDYVVQMIRKSIEKYCVDVQIPNEPMIYPLKTCNICIHLSQQH